MKRLTQLDKAQAQAQAEQTLEIMRVLDRTVEEGDCLIWQGATGVGGYPIYKPYRKPCTLVRRAVFAWAKGDLVARQPIVATCGDTRCINPDHLVRSTASAVGKTAAKHGAYAALTRRAKISAAKRVDCKLDAEKAMEIRYSNETGVVLAARYGVVKSVISAIKRGEVWKDYTPSPWAGLGGA